MYGSQASEPGQYAVDLFPRQRKHDVLELGAGQGRDTFAFLAAGFSVTALDYASESLLAMRKQAESFGVAERLDVTSHDVRAPLSLPRRKLRCPLLPHALQHGTHRRT
jgi:predicted RNA methylase